MSAFNVVRFRVKPGHDRDFLDAHRNAKVGLRGLKQATMVKTGENSYCLVGEWSSIQRLAAARPEMIALLDTFRAHLEDLGGGLGVTDPVSGEAVLTLRPPRKAEKAVRKAAKKSAKKAKNKKAKTKAKKKAKR